MKGPALARVTKPDHASTGIVFLRLTLSVLWIVLGLVMCFALFPLLTRPKRTKWAGWWARGFTRRLGVAVAVQGQWPTSSGRFMMVSNHITWLDIFVILGVRPVRFVSKSEVRHWPVAGYLAACAGTLFINRMRKRDTVHIGAAMLAAMEAGEVIGIFPEGTTTDGSVLRPFFSPLLQPALNGEAQIVPTALRYHDAHGARDSQVPFIGEQTFVESFLLTARRRELHVTVSFGAPIQSEQGHRRELTRQVEGAVADLLNVPIDATWRPPE